MLLKVTRFFFNCCFTSAETLRLFRDGESRTATSAFTQLSLELRGLCARTFTAFIRNSVTWTLKFVRNTNVRSTHQNYVGHLATAVACRNNTEYVHQRPPARWMCAMEITVQGRINTHTHIHTCLAPERFLIKEKLFFSSPYVFGKTTH